MCNLSAGYSNPSCKIVGGVKEVYIANYLPNAAFTVTGTAISGTSANGTYYKFEQRNGVASYSESANQSTENLTSFMTGTLTIDLEKVDAATKNTVNILMKGLWRILFLSENGQWFHIGVDSPVHTTAVQGGVGKSWGDASKYAITFTSLEKVPVYNLTGTPGSLGFTLG